jgi:hypothetical protein
MTNLPRRAVLPGMLWVGGIKWPPESLLLQVDIGGVGGTLLWRIICPTSFTFAICDQKAITTLTGPLVWLPIKIIFHPSEPQQYTWWLAAPPKQWQVPPWDYLRSRLAFSSCKLLDQLWSSLQVPGAISTIWYRHYILPCTHTPICFSVDYSNPEGELFCPAFPKSFPARCIRILNFFTWAACPESGILADGRFLPQACIWEGTTGTARQLYLCYDGKF